MRAMDILVAVAHMFPIPSPFFSVDIAERQDGIFRIVEIGTGRFRIWYNGHLSVSRKFGVVNVPKSYN